MRRTEGKDMTSTRKYRIFPSVGTALLFIPAIGCTSETAPYESKPIPVTDTSEEQEDSGQTTEPLPLDVMITGSGEHRGLGYAVELGEAWWAGAPDGERGALYQITSEGLSLVLEGDGRLGHAIAEGAGGLVVSAPLDDKLYSAAGEIILGERTTLLEASEDGWLAATEGGWLREDGTSGLLHRRASSLCDLGGSVAAGFALGDTALLLGSQSLERTHATDLMGYSLISGDFDGDGQDELAVGAPGASKVAILDGSDLNVRGEYASEARGFGQAIAAADVDQDGTDEIWIADESGTVGLYSDLSGTPVWEFQLELSDTPAYLSLSAQDSLLLVGIPNYNGGEGAVYLTQFSPEQ